MPQRVLIRQSRADLLRRSTTTAVVSIMSIAMVSAAFDTALAQHPRKAGHKSQPASLSKTAPDTTGTVAPGKKPEVTDNEAKPTPPPPAYTTTRYDEGLPRPFDLPAAPRARMRACGLKWQTIKLSGESRSDTWREFATKCLVDDSVSKASR